MCFDGTNGRADRPGHEHVVAIVVAEVRDIVTQVIERRVPGGGNASIRLVSQHLHAIIFHPVLKDLGGAISRAVVDDQQSEAWVVLAQDALDGLGKDVRAVVGDRDDRDHRGHRQLLSLGRNTPSWKWRRPRAASPRAAGGSHDTRVANLRRMSLPAREGLRTTLERADLRHRLLGETDYASDRRRSIGPPARVATQEGPQGGAPCHLALVKACAPRLKGRGWLSVPVSPLAQRSR